MAFYNFKRLPTGDCEGDPGLGIGWYFEHAATGEWIGPFKSRNEAEREEARHYLAREPVPAWSLYES